MNDVMATLEPERSKAIARKLFESWTTEFKEAMTKKRRKIDACAPKRK